MESRFRERHKFDKNGGKQWEMFMNTEHVFPEIPYFFFHLLYEILIKYCRVILSWGKHSPPHFTSPSSSDFLHLFQKLMLEQVNHEWTLLWLSSCTGTVQHLWFKASCKSDYCSVSDFLTLHWWILLLHTWQIILSKQFTLHFDQCILWELNSWPWHEWIYE